MERPLTAWERGVLEALVSIDGPAGGPDPATLRDAVEHLVVVGGCDCGCPSFTLLDTRRRGMPREGGSFHYSNAASTDGRVGFFLLVSDGVPADVDVMLPPELSGDEPEARPAPSTLVVTSPWDDEAPDRHGRGLRRTRFF